MKKLWKPHPDPCDLCGDATEIYTDAVDYGYGYDGDPMRCLGCCAGGYWVVSDDDAYSSWGEGE